MKCILRNLTTTVVLALIFGIGCCQSEPSKKAHAEVDPGATGSSPKVERGRQIEKGVKEDLFGADDLSVDRNRQIELGMKADALEYMNRYPNLFPEPTLSPNTDYPTTYPNSAPPGGN